MITKSLSKVRQCDSIAGQSASLLSRGTVLSHGTGRDSQYSWTISECKTSWCRLKLFSWSPKVFPKWEQWDSIVGQSAFSFKKKSVTAAAAATVDQVSLTILNPLLGFSLTLRYSQYRRLLYFFGRLQSAQPDGCIRAWIEYRAKKKLLMKNHKILKLIFRGLDCVQTSKNEF